MDSVSLQREEASSDILYRTVYRRTRVPERAASLTGSSEFCCLCYCFWGHSTVLFDPSDSRASHMCSEFMASPKEMD